MKGWRTIIFNVAIIAGHLTGIFPAPVDQYIELVAGVGNLVLRLFTTTPIGQSHN